MPKLYISGLSPNSRRVMMAIHENGRDDYEVVHVDLSKGGNKTPEFLAINPNGKVPALDDGDTKLWESIVMMQYLSQESPLWPASKARYDIARWQVWGVAHHQRWIDTIGFEKMLKGMFGLGEPDMARVAEAEVFVERFNGVLDGHLEGREWLVGDAITLADLSVAVAFTYAPAVGISLEAFPNVARWLAKIQERPSWKATLPPQLA